LWFHWAPLLTPEATGPLPPARNASAKALQEAAHSRLDDAGSLQAMPFYRRWKEAEGVKVPKHRNASGLTFQRTAKAYSSPPPGMPALLPLTPKQATKPHVEPAFPQIAVYQIRRRWTSFPRSKT